MTNDAHSRQSAVARSGIPPDEAALIWDEYKYRHDLIWRHLIRSTVAVVGLITVSYSNSLKGDRPLFVVAALLAVGYSIFNFFVINSEIGHYDKIENLHRKRQIELFELHESAERDSLRCWTFKVRVNAFMGGLLVLALLATWVTLTCSPV